MDQHQTNDDPHGLWEEMQKAEFREAIWKLASRRSYLRELPNLEMWCNVSMAALMVHSSDIEGGFNYRDLVMTAGRSRLTQEHRDAEVRLNDYFGMLGRFYKITQEMWDSYVEN